jgi:hypothetical protein
MRVFSQDSLLLSHLANLLLNPGLYSLPCPSLVSSMGQHKQSLLEHPLDLGLPVLGGEHQSLLPVGRDSQTVCLLHLAPHSAVLCKGDRLRGS